MKEIIVHVGGKEHTKLNPSIDDYVNSVRHGAKVAEAGENAALSEEVLNSIIDVVARAVGVSPDALRKENNFAEVMQAWRDLQGNLLEAYTGMGGEEKNV